MATQSPLLIPTSTAPQPALREHIRRQWQHNLDTEGSVWVFGYASLIWRPDFTPVEVRPARVHGWHRALAMWSHVNRGTPSEPGLVFALLAGGSCRGVVYQIPPQRADSIFKMLWAREMPTDVYEPRWLLCHTASGPIHALAFTLPRTSPAYTGKLSATQYQHIFKRAIGRYGSTLDYASATLESLSANGVQDHSLAQLLTHANEAQATSE